MLNDTDIVYIIDFTVNLSPIYEHDINISLYKWQSIQQYMYQHKPVPFFMYHINMNGSVLFQQQPEVEDTRHSG